MHSLVDDSSEEEDDICYYPEFFVEAEINEVHEEPDDSVDHSDASPLLVPIEAPPGKLILYIFSSIFLRKFCSI